MTDPASYAACALGREMNESRKVAYEHLLLLLEALYVYETAHSETTHARTYSLRCSGWEGMEGQKMWVMQEEEMQVMSTHARGVVAEGRKQAEEAVGAALFTRHITVHHKSQGGGKKGTCTSIEAQIEFHSSISRVMLYLGRRSEQAGSTSVAPAYTAGHYATPTHAHNSSGRGATTKSPRYMSAAAVGALLLKVAHSLAPLYAF